MEGESRGDMLASSFHFLCFCVFLTFYVEMIVCYQKAEKIVQRGPLNPSHRLPSVALSYITIVVVSNQEMTLAQNNS